MMPAEEAQPMTGYHDTKPFASLRVTDAKTGKTTRMMVGYSQTLVASICEAMLSREMTRIEFMDGLIVFTTLHDAPEST